METKATSCQCVEYNKKKLWVVFFLALGNAALLNGIRAESPHFLFQFSSTILSRHKPTQKLDFLSNATLFLPETDTKATVRLSGTIFKTRNEKNRQETRKKIR